MITPMNPLTPWLTIWLKPRETIQRIVKKQSDYQLFLLATLSGIAGAVQHASARDLGDTVSVPALIILIILLAPISQFIGFYFKGFILRRVGSWLGGQALTEDVVTVLAWASVPQIFGLVLWLPLLAIFGNELFTSATPTTDAMFTTHPLLALLVLLMFIPIIAIDVLLWIWGQVILVAGLAEVHAFSVWRALATMVIPIFSLIVVLICPMTLIAINSKM